MSALQVVCLLLIFSSALSSAQDDLVMNNVEISGVKVTLICPKGEEEGGGDVTWKKDNTEITEKSETHVIKRYTEKDNSMYTCKRDTTTYYFYTKMKVCEGCVEFDVIWAGLMMFADVLVTLGVIVLVYMCSKKKSRPAAPQRAVHARQAMAPPPPDPDYQPLNQATRSKDVYAEARRK